MCIYLHMYLHTYANMHACILTLRETEAGRLQLPRVFCNLQWVISQGMPHKLIYQLIKT